MHRLALRREMVAEKNSTDRAILEEQIACLCDIASALPWKIWYRLCVKTTDLNARRFDVRNIATIYRPLKMRTAEQLKKCWESMKNRRKKELAAEKIERMATGGGSYKPPADSENAVIDDIFSSVDIELKDVIDSHRAG
ncbi:hypothetical protein FQR65_LT16113 [Abscondita terminalis]|nr:hypothetical protein FQR65_LT16113 [Abscondita terminalis]